MSRVPIAEQADCAVAAPGDGVSEVGRAARSGAQAHVHAAVAIAERVGVGEPVQVLFEPQEPALQKRVACFTRAYESARFGRSADDAKALPELFEEIAEIR